VLHSLLCAHGAHQLFSQLIKTDINGNVLWNKKLGSMQYDYTPLYKEKQVNHSGNVSYSNYRVLSYLLSVGIKYRFQTKNKSSKYAVIKE
jgi:hypothetical protein